MRADAAPGVVGDSVGDDGGLRGRGGVGGVASAAAWLRATVLEKIGTDASLLGTELRVRLVTDGSVRQARRLTNCRTCDN